MSAYAVSVWSLLGDPSRRRIIERLVRGPSSVVELARELPISRPAVSQHLRLLKQAGLVNDSPQGTRRIYTVDVARLDQFRRELDEFWGSTLSQLATDAASLQRSPPSHPSPPASADQRPHREGTREVT